MAARYLLPALALVCLSFAALQVRKAEQQPPRVTPPVEPARTSYDKTVAGAGVVEPETENIAVGANLPGVVKAVHVKVDEVVKAGDVLFELDDRQLRAEGEVRAASLAAARAQEAKIRVAPRAEEVPVLEARLREAEANLDGKTKLYTQAKRSEAQGSTSQEDLI